MSGRGKMSAGTPLDVSAATAKRNHSIDTSLVFWRGERVDPRGSRDGHPLLEGH